MYSERHLEQMKLEGIVNKFNIKLDEKNRWIRLSKIVPWEEIEKKYAAAFKNERKDGRRAISARMAIGTLIIQEIMQLSDRETVEIIKENPYMQYFLGYNEFEIGKIFDASSIVHFRKRLDIKSITEINKMLQEKVQKSEKKEKENNSKKTKGEIKEVTEKEEEMEEEEQKNQGKLILDATCVPSDIRYPTDLTLLNEGREKLEKAIDKVWENTKEKGETKPRTYRKEARKGYLEKAKKPGKKGMRKAIKKQLQYVIRDIKILEELNKKAEEKGKTQILTAKEEEEIETIKKVYEQQEKMYKEKTHKIKDRIVSICQNWVRPIVRGKAKAPVEFGAKIEISVVNGFTEIEKTDWNNFNEGKGLKDAIEIYKERYGYYPEAVLVDKLYRNRENIAYCKEKGIRISGPSLGRPKKDVEETKLTKKLEYEDSCERNTVEGKFGEAKRKYGLEKIKTKLKETSETVIGMNIFVINLMRAYRRSRNFFYIFYIFSKKGIFYYFGTKNLIKTGLLNESLLILY